MLYIFFAVAAVLGSGILLFLGVLFLLGHLTRACIPEPIDTAVGIISMLFISYMVTALIGALVFWFWVLP
jgi:hypothetical protein